MKTGDEQFDKFKEEMYSKYGSLEYKNLDIKLKHPPCVSSMEIAWDASRKEIEEKLRVATEALENINDPKTIWVNSAKDIADKALGKITKKDSCAHQWEYLHGNFKQCSQCEEKAIK